MRQPILGKDRRLLAAVRERPWDAASVLVLAALLAVILATFLDYGMTWDESLQNRYGRRIVRWYATLGADRSATDQNNLYFYGGLFELAVQAAEPLSGLGVYENRHLVNALFGFLGFVAVWGLGRHGGGAAAGCLSVLFLALAPGYYGHVFANPKDLPFASLYALGAWLVLRASEKMPRLGRWEIAVVGLAIGLAAGVRVAGLALFGYAALLWAGSMWLDRGPAGGPSSRRRPLLGLGLAWLGTLVVGWTVMVAAWPWAQLDPVRNPLRALRVFSEFWNPDLLYAGRIVSADALPRSYLPELLALTLPEFYPLAFLLGGLSLLLLFRGAGERPRGRQVLRVAWLVALALLPIAWVVARRTPLYNGYRHVLFVVPFLAVLAGVGASSFLRSRAPRPARAAALIALGASLGLAAVDAVQLHPYQYVYFNRLFAGGLRSAAGRYDTDYWGASYKEGIEWLVHHYSRRDLGRPIRVTGHYSVHVPLQYYLEKTEEGRRRFQVVTIDRHPDLIFATTSYRSHQRTPGRPVHVVERQGGALLYIFEVDHPERQ